MLATYATSKMNFHYQRESVSLYVEKDMSFINFMQTFPCEQGKYTRF